MDLLEKQLSRQQFGLESALALSHAIRVNRPTNFKELLALSFRIQLCNSNANQFSATDFHSTETGELYDSIGRYWRCGSKLCPHCLAFESSRRRKQLQSAIARQKLLVGENFNFITLTIPNPSKTLIETRKIVARAWELFRKRKYISESFLGCAKSEEFTFTARGYHYHLHLLIRSRYINYQLVRQIWTDCLRISFAESDLELFCATSDGLAICKIIKVSDLKQIVHELCKYVTKNDCWQKIPTSDLIEVAGIKRFPRMFELLGSFKSISQEKTILDTNSLSDGKRTENCRYWRNQVSKNGLRTYLKTLELQFINCREVRTLQLHSKYPYSTLTPKSVFFEFVHSL